MCKTNQVSGYGTLVPKSENTQSSCRIGKQGSNRFKQNLTASSPSLYLCPHFYFQISLFSLSGYTIGKRPNHWIPINKPMMQSNDGQS